MLGGRRQIDQIGDDRHDKISITWMYDNTAEHGKQNMRKQKENILRIVQNKRTRNLRIVVRVDSVTVPRIQVRVCM